jgi:protein TonB
MKKPSLPGMIVLSVALHGALLAGGWAAASRLFRIDAGERVPAVITADVYRVEKPRDAQDLPAPPRDFKEPEKKPGGRKAGIKPPPSGEAVDTAETAEADLCAPMDPEPAAAAAEMTAPSQKVTRDTAPQGKPASAKPAGQAPGPDEEKAIGLIHAAVKKAVEYPFMARKHGIEGTVQVSFHVAPGGWPSDIRVEKSSGFDILDQAAVKAVKNGKPYPSVAKAVAVPIRFSMKTGSQ